MDLLKLANPSPPPPHLTALQRGLRALVTRTPADDPGVLSAEGVYGLIGSDDGFPAAARVDVYASAWLWRLHGSLVGDYEALAQSLGDAAFRCLVKDYLAACPSQSYTLAHAGDRLPDFLDHWQHPSKAPWHGDLARLERSYYQARVAADPRPWDLAALAHASPDEVEGLRLTTEAAVFLGAASWHIDQVWRGKVACPRRGRRYYLVYRRGFSVRVKTLRARVFKLLSSIAGQCTLGDLIDLYPDEKTVQQLFSLAAEGIVKPLTGDEAQNLN